MYISLNIFIVSSIFACTQSEGVARPPLRIINGTTAAEGEFPYMVQLRLQSGMFVCGGAIIGPEWILTAGHCNGTGEIASIVYGTTKMYDYGDGYPNTSVNVKHWFRHPKYSENIDGIPIYDVAILQLEEPIPFSDTVKPVRLAASNATVPFYIQGILSGWGVNTTFGNPPPYLQKINRTLLSDEECTQKVNDYSPSKAFNATHHICSDDNQDGLCFGDSGSPLVINGTEYGIVSWTCIPCGVVPGAYSRITNPEYRDWIKDITYI